MTEDPADEKNDEFVRVMLPASLKARIKERAGRTRRSVSAWCRLVLERHFEAEDEKARQEATRQPTTRPNYPTTAR